ncbi:DNA cytosine methyltransferase [Cellulosimicrobium funkei]|uniref:DNA cytosine methyltransferase n=1 Tax=Cellulosimicrobium funkei TaxID=264251 RepID=UPI00365D1EAC
MSAATVTDLFCGAGGSSTGMVQIPGVQVVIAANHWSLAIETHNQNHPDTDHAAVDLHQEDPRYFPRTDVLWASPECTKWSQANGSKPLPAIEEGLFEDPLSAEAATRSRLLMFDVLRFAEHHRYRAMIIENVVDIATQAKYRLAWYEWRQQLRALGYRFRVVSLNSMHAQTYGLPAPQSRDRIYIVCWREGERAPDVERILRPSAYCPKCDELIRATQSWKNGKTVGRYRQTYLYTHARCGTVVEPAWLPAAAAIDWSIPGERIGDRLKPKTRARIAAGIARYWGPIHIEALGNQYDAADPKHPQHGDPNAYYRAWSVEDVIRTLHTQETKGLAVPAGGTWNDEALPVDHQPMRTLTTRDTTGLAHPPFIAELYGTSTARPVSEPAGTFTAGGNHHGLAQHPDPFILDRRFEYRARSIDDPLSTITANDTTKALVSPYYGSATHAKPVDEPIGTLTTVDRYALVHRHNTGGAEMTTPVFEELRTLTAAGHQSLLQQPGPRDGRRTVTAADLKAAEELVPEVLFRMFRPHEVAAGMAFPSDYRWDATDPKTGRPASNRDLVKMAGNAVTPPAARDLVATVVEALTGEAVAA